MNIVVLLLFQSASHFNGNTDDFSYLRTGICVPAVYNKINSFAVFTMQLHFFHK